jgi:hypothetical protein
MKLVSFAPLFPALFLASACDALTSKPEAPEAEQPPAASAPSTPAELPSVGPKANAMRTAVIDWERARSDRAEQDTGEDGLVSTASSAELAPVPVLLPSSLVAPASATRGVMFRQTSDGYFASYPGEVYDVVINGTNLIAGTGEGAAARPDKPVFTSSLAGAQLSLSRYGADYLIEFECNIDLPEDADTCITEGEALDMAEKLIVAGTR